MITLEGILKDVMKLKAKILFLFLVAAIMLSGCVSYQTPVTETVICTDICTEVSSVPESTTEPIIQTIPTIDVPAGSHQRRFECDDTNDYLDYYLFVPQDAVADMPLVIFLHGDGEVGNIDKLESFGPIQCIRDIYGENFPFVMISPCTRQRTWTKNTIPETLMALIRSVIDECSIDPDRVIITGHSRGASGVWFLISEYGDFFSAAVPVSCGSENRLNYENVSKVAVYALSGDIGVENNYRSDMEKLISGIRDHGGSAYFKILEGFGHADTSTAAYTLELFEWMLEQ